MGGRVGRRRPRPSVGRMGDAKVYVIDHVVTRPGRAREFVDRYLSEYAPGAAERGMTLDRLLISPPIWFADESNTVTACWELAGAQAWWEMTWKGRPDPSIGEWWSQIGELVAERSRSVAAAAGDIDGLCDV